MAAKRTRLRACAPETRLMGMHEMSSHTLLDHGENTHSALLTLDEALSKAGDSVSEFKAALEDANQALIARFEEGEPATGLVRRRAALVDRVLLRLWKLHAGDLGNSVALVAVGGYGRGELHPCSDVDIIFV